MSIHVKARRASGRTRRWLCVMNISVGDGPTEPRALEGYKDSQRVRVLLRMPLHNGMFPEFRYDGQYIHFRMEDGPVVVRCAVTTDFLDALARTDAIGLKHHRTLFTLYRDEVERIASRKYDAGDGMPLVTTSDLPSSASRNPI